MGVSSDVAGSRNETPRIGPGRALARADNVEDIPRELAKVPRFECQNCGDQQFSRADICGECGAYEIERVPGPGVDDEE